MGMLAGAGGDPSRQAQMCTRSAQLGSWTSCCDLLGAMHVTGELYVQHCRLPLLTVYGLPECVLPTLAVVHCHPCGGSRVAQARCH